MYAQCMANRSGSSATDGGVPLGRVWDVFAIEVYLQDQLDAYWDFMGYVSSWLMWRHRITHDIIMTIQ